MVMEWDRARALIRSGRLEQLVRSEDVTRRYREHKEALGSVDVSDFVLDRLQWSGKELEYLNEKKYRSVEEKISVALSSQSLYKLSWNDFPYDFPANVYHLLVWSKIILPLYENDDSEGNRARQVPHMHDRIEEFFRLTLQDRLHIPQGDYCWFVNYSSLQSIKKISHIHLLIRTDNEELIEKRILGQPGLEPLRRLDGVEETEKSTVSFSGEAEETVEIGKGNSATAH